MILCLMICVFWLLRAAIIVIIVLFQPSPTSSTDPVPTTASPAAIQTAKRQRIDGKYTHTLFINGGWRKSHAAV